MSGITGSKLNIRGSGRIAKLGTDGQALTSAGAGMAAAFEDLAAGISWQTIETGSTMTAVAGNGYWVDTTSNACTITLPASASVGDTIIFTDYARNWGTNSITLDFNGLNYQSKDDSYTAEYTTDGMTVAITYMNATQGWVPTIDEAVSVGPGLPSNLYGIFAYGSNNSSVNLGTSQLVSSSGVVGSDVSAVGTARSQTAACEYGLDKGIHGFGYINTASTRTAITNLVSNTGVVATDTAGVGTARMALAAATYGASKGIFGFGDDASSKISMTSLVSNTGVVGSDVTGVGTARHYPAACEYGTNKVTAIFGFGYDGSSHVGMTNLVSSTGVVASDVTAVGTGRSRIAACDYGGDKGIFGFGKTASMLSMTNLVSNVGVVATDTTGVGSARGSLGACEYGTDKGIFGFGYDGAVGMTNLVSNAGVVATDVTAVDGVREYACACSYG